MLNPGSSHCMPTNGSTKEDIGQWLDMKEIEFVVDQNKNPWISVEKWLQRYVFTNLHEIFFVDFSNILAEWIQRLVEQNQNISHYCSRNWTPELIRQVNTIRNRYHTCS
jgi:hypothetical protein